MSAYSGPDDQEGMRKTDFRPELNPGDRGSVSGVLVCWPLDLGSTPDGSLSFSFPLDHLGLSMQRGRTFVW